MFLRQHNLSGICCFLSCLLLTLTSSGSVAADIDDDPLLFKVTIHQLEQRYGDEDATALEAEAWVGYDLDKLWIKTHVERVAGETKKSELQVLYSKAISPFWNLELGARHDSEPQPDRTWAAVGLHGLAPYYIHIDTTLFVGDEGRSLWRFKVENESLLTQRWVAISEMKVDVSGKTDEATETGSGLVSSELGLRVAYEFRREFAAYLGVNWEQKYGNTADFAKEHGEGTSDTQFVVGFHIWF